LSLKSARVRSVKSLTELAVPVGRVFTEALYPGLGWFAGAGFRTRVTAGRRLVLVRRGDSDPRVPRDRQEHEGSWGRSDPPCSARGAGARGLSAADAYELVLGNPATMRSFHGLRKGKERPIDRRCGISGPKRSPSVRRPGLGAWPRGVL
jgi:hypothetical protein